ncbi:hypothetical protein ACSQ67_004752 [Phaseolus vulgaris]
MAPASLSGRMASAGVGLRTVANSENTNKFKCVSVCIFSFFLKGFLNSLHLIPSQKKPFTVIDGVSGIIKPKRMTLLLGPPRFGKTTLLLALAGRLGKDLEFSGRVSHNGRGMEEFVPQENISLHKSN